MTVPYRPAGYLLGWEDAGTVHPVVEPYSDDVLVCVSAWAADRHRGELAETNYSPGDRLRIYALVEVPDSVVVEE